MTKPHTRGENWELSTSDYLEFLGTIEDGSVDLLLTDLPYGVLDSSYDIAPTQDELNRFAVETIRTLKENGSVFAFCSHIQLEQLKTAFRSIGFTKERFGAWVKTTNNLAPTPYPKSNLEFWFFLSKSKGMTKNRLLPLYLSKGSQRLKKGEARQSFRKPVSLCRTIIHNHSPVGGLVVDCFAGSGSTGIAALLEGRKTKLNEINKRKIKPMVFALSQFKEYSVHKKLEGFLSEEGQISSTQKRTKKETITKDKEEQKTRKKQKFPAKKREKVCRIILGHNLQQPMEPYDFITAVRIALGIPALEEARIYKLCWSIIRGIRGAYPDANLTIPRETKEAKSIRLYEEFSQEGKKKPIPFELNQKPRVRTERRRKTEGLTPDEKLARINKRAEVATGKAPDKRRSTKTSSKPKRKPQPKQQSLLPKENERRGKTEGLTDDEKLDRITKRAKVQTGMIPDKRKGEKA